MPLSNPIRGNHVRQYELAVVRYVRCRLIIECLISNHTLCLP